MTQRRRPPHPDHLRARRRATSTRIRPADTPAGRPRLPRRTRRATPPARSIPAPWPTSATPPAPPATPAPSSSSTAHSTPTCATTARDFGLGPGTPALQLAPLGYDASIRDTFAPLLAGGRLLVVARSAASCGPPNFSRRRTALPGAALLSTTPIVPGLPGRATRPCRPLAGSPGRLQRRIPAAPSHRRRPRDGPGRLVNQYGPTECTMTTTRHAVPADPDTAADMVGTPHPRHGRPAARPRPRARPRRHRRRGLHRRRGRRPRLRRPPGPHRRPLPARPLRPARRPPLPHRRPRPVRPRRPRLRRAHRPAGQDPRLPRRPRRDRGRPAGPPRRQRRRGHRRHRRPGSHVPGRPRHRRPGRHDRRPAARSTWPAHSRRT